MVEGADRTGHAHDHGVDRHHVDRVIEEQDAPIHASAGNSCAWLSEGAVLHDRSRRRPRPVSCPTILPSLDRSADQFERSPTTKLEACSFDTNDMTCVLTGQYIRLLARARCGRVPR